MPRVACQVWVHYSGSASESSNVKNGVHTHCIKTRDSDWSLNGSMISYGQEQTRLKCLCSVSGQGRECPTASLPPGNLWYQRWLFAKCITTLQHTIRFTKRLHTRHLDQDYCTHTNVSGRNHFVCLACSLYMFCAAPPNPPFINAHSDTHTLLLLSPWIFHQSLIFARPGRPEPVQRDANSDPTVLRHRKPVRSLFELFFSFYLSCQSCFHHLGFHLSRTAHNISLHS